MNERLNFRFLLVFLVGIFVSFNAMAQDITVKGHVKDTYGEPVMLATVLQKGTSNGTTTDMNGNFTMKAPRGATLVISFIGFQTKEVAAAPSLMVVMQEDTKVLSEAVVIGYGSVKKDDLTGSVTAIRPDAISKNISTNAQDMLVGKIAGVSVITNDGTPGGGASIRIRGGASLNASNDPLIVIDGLAMDNSGVQGLSNPLSMVNPEDIETFTVLKDASATAIYGSRASNGVIIITTKKGQSNEFRPKVTYSGTFSVSHARKTYEVLSGDEYRDYVINTLGQSGNGLGTANTNWMDEVLQTAIGHDHQIGISGAVKSLGNLPYRVSLGYSNKDGIVKTSNFERFTAALNLNPTFLDNHLAVNLSAKYMHAKNRYADAGAAIGGALRTDPTQPIHDDTYPEFGGYWQNVVNANMNNPEWTHISNTNTPQNPVALLNLQNKRANSDVLIGGIDADYKIHGFEDLRIHASLSGDYSEGRELNSISPYSYSNNYYGWEGVDQSYKYNVLANIYAQYAHEFSNNQKFDVMVGAEQQHFHRSYYSYGQGNEWYDENGNILDTPVAYSPSLRSEKAHITPKYSLVSYFGRLNYSALDRYLLTFTMRADGSSRFATGNKWGYFPAVGLAWKINEEPFMKNATAFDDLKLRLGWGLTGQQDLGTYNNTIMDFYYLPRYVTGDQYAQYSLGTSDYYMIRPEVYNSDLKWEKTATWNAGLDWSFLNGRIDGSLDFYYRKTTDLMSAVPVASGIHFGNYLIKNIGELTNKGVEFSINAHPISTRDFSWTVNYNCTWNANKITKLYDDADYVLTGDKISAGLDNKVQVNKVGYAANSFYVYQQVYDEAGKPIEGVFVDRNADGVINADDKYVYKKPTADVTMGLTNKFIWKRWDFSFSLRASLNNYLYYDFLAGKANVSYAGIYSNSAYNNTTGEAVSLGFQGKTDYYMSDYFIRNASFVRCDNINLGYSFDHLFSGDSYKGIGGRVYVTVSNPFVITKYDGIDPERKHGSGVDGNVFPRPVSYVLGLSLNF